MTDRYPGALLVSLTLHGAVAGLMFLFAYAANLSRPETTQVFELVAGDGDNFAAMKAPALGEPGALKMDLPKSAPEEPKPREVTPPEPTPVAPAPIPPAPEEKPLPKPTNYAKEIEKKIDRVEANTKAKLAKQHAAEAKKLEEANKKLTKEQFDKQNQKKIASATPAGPPKVTKIDSEGIRKGVEAGSIDNKTGGARGTALVRSDGSVMDAYFAMLKDRLRTALDKPPGLSDSLVTTVQVRINADGSLTGAKIVKSSGSDEFDAASMAAVAAIRMPARPDKKSEDSTVQFRMKEVD